MVKTRMQLMNEASQTQYAGYANAVSTIYKNEGLGGFYRGVTASYWGATEGAIQFMVYEKLKKKEVRSWKCVNCLVEGVERRT